MAISATGTSNSISRSSSYLTLTGPWSRLIWAQVPTAVTNGVTRLWQIGDPAHTHAYVALLASTTSGVTTVFIETFDGTTTHDSATYLWNSATWSAFGVTVDTVGSVVSLYVWPTRGSGSTLVGTISVNPGSFTWTSANDTALVNSTASANAAIEYDWVWSGVQTLSVMQAQVRSIPSVGGSGLIAATRLAGNNNVTSPNGPAWTITGTLGYVDGPLPPANLTPALATDISLLLPYAITVDTQDAPQGTGHSVPGSANESQEVWWKLTAQTTSAGPIRAISVQFSNTDSSGSPPYEPALQVWTGSNPASLTALTGQTQGATWTTAGTTVYTSVGLTLTTTYYLQLIGSGVYPLGALNGSLVLTVLGPDQNHIVAGDVAVLPSNPNVPAILLNPTTGAFVSELGFDNTQYAAILPTGVICANALDQTTGKTTAFDVYTDICTKLMSVTSPISGSVNANSPVSTDWNATFYVAVVKSTSAAVVSTISPTGTVGGTSWTLPDPSSRSLYGMAPSRNGNLLYWVQNLNSQAIHVYDLQHNMAASDLVAGATNVQYGDDVVVDSAGDVIVVASVNSSASPIVWNAKRYSSAGSLLATYAIGSSAASNAPRMCLSADGLSIWTFLEVYLANTNTPFTLQQTRLSDGAVLETFPGLVRKESDNLTFASTFGLQESPPLVQLSATPSSGPNNPNPAPSPPAPPGPGVPTTARVQRRYRRFALPFEGNLYHFLERLEVLVQSGQGLSSGTFTNPVLMLRISRDGGLTWGNEIQLQTGAIGQFNYRAYVNRLGRGRNFVVEIADTDPVFSALLDCYIDYEQGTA